MKLLFSFVLVFSLLHANTINIAVAANVSYAIDTLKQKFIKKHPDVKVRVTLGSSGKLTAQIKNGAPYGLFMSANMDYPEALYRDGLATLKPEVYAKGSLAYFSVKEQDFSLGLKLLEQKQIRKIAIANPKTAPYGKAAAEALTNAKVYTLLKPKFIYGESISQTLFFTIAAADIGIVATSSLLSPKMKRYKEGKNWSSVAPELYTPIKQGVVLLKVSKNAQAYRDFYSFLFSKEAQNIFKQYGYILP